MDSTLNVVATFGLGHLLDEIIGVALSSHQWQVVNFEQASEEKFDIVLAQGLGDTEEVVAGIRHIHEKLPECKIVLFGVEGNDAEIIRYIQEGACAYVSTKQSLADLARTLAMVRDNLSSCSGSVTQLVIGMIHQLSRGRRKPESRLTLRENQILRMIRNGLSNKEIAEELSITPNTVKNHVHHLLEKLRVRSRHEAAQVEAMIAPLRPKPPQVSSGRKTQPALLRSMP